MASRATTSPLRHKGFVVFSLPELLRSSSWDSRILYMIRHPDRPWTLMPPSRSDRTLRSAAPPRPSSGRDGLPPLRPVQYAHAAMRCGDVSAGADALGASEFRPDTRSVAFGPTVPMHTYNRHAGLRSIDLFGQIPGLQRLRSLMVSLAPDSRTSRLLLTPLCRAPGTRRPESLSSGI